jgi:hypothetical protein
MICIGDSDPRQSAMDRTVGEGSRRIVEGAFSFPSTLLPLFTVHRPPHGPLSEVAVPCPDHPIVLK